MAQKGSLRMDERTLTQSEQDLLKTIKHGIDKADELKYERIKTRKELDIRIEESRVLLRAKSIDVGRTQSVGQGKSNFKPVREPIKVRSFGELLVEANDKYPDDISFEDIFTDEEIIANREYINQLNKEFHTIHKLDKIDIIIPAVAGIFGGIIDCAFGGFLRGENGEAIPGTLSTWVRDKFDKALPAEKIKELENFAKVTFDAPTHTDNKGNIIVNEYVDGLTPYFHHVVSLGHDPILGFIFGVMDMLRGTMTTLDYKGKFIIQTVEGFSDNKALSIFEAIIKEFLHLISDVNGSSTAKAKSASGMGLPVPFMALFNTLQFGSIGEDNLTIPELTKNMFYEGYDFRHFCSMSIPTMIVEVIVRLSYFAKRLSEGFSFKDAIPVGLNHEKKPKLATMLYIAHTSFTAINAGKVAITKDPMNINYAEWLMFAKLTIKQLKWVLLTKPTLREKYVMGIVNNEWEMISEDIDMMWQETLKE